MFRTVSNTYSFGGNISGSLPLITNNPVTTNLIASLEMFQPAARDQSNNLILDSTGNGYDLKIEGSQTYTFDSNGALIPSINTSPYNSQNWLRVNDSVKRKTILPWSLSSFVATPQPRTFIFWAALNENPNSTSNRNNLLSITSSGGAFDETLNFQYAAAPFNRFFGSWSDSGGVSSWTVYNGNYRDDTMRMYAIRYDGSNDTLNINVNGVDGPFEGSGWWSALFPSNGASSATMDAEWLINITGTSSPYSSAVTPMRLGAIYVYDAALTEAQLTNIYNQTNTFVS